MSETTHVPATPISPDEQLDDPDEILDDDELDPSIDDDDDDSPDMTDPASIIEQELAKLAESGGLNFEWEDAPAATRSRTVTPTVIIPWETTIGTTLKANPGKFLKVFAFPETKKSRAVSRAAEIRKRFFEVEPQMDYTVWARQNKTDLTWCVYVRFNKVLNDEELQDKLSKYENQKKILEDARAKNPRFADSNTQETTAGMPGVTA